MSPAQIGQDIAVLQRFYPDGNNPRASKSRYFVEVGATDGLTLSNTKLLEDQDWQGLCIEASPVVQLLRKNRKCSCIQACVYSTETEVDFVLDNREPYHLMAGIKDCLHNGTPMGQVVTYHTVTLDQVLAKAQAPSLIDYLSLDVEGAEWEVLRNFPFHKYRFGVISLHHNNAPWRGQLQIWLQANDYRLLGPNIWEEWWVHNEVFPTNWLNNGPLRALTEVYAVPMGGLGNQLFCAMAAVQYARKYGATAYYSLDKNYLNPADHNNPNKVFYFDQLIHLPQGSAGYAVAVREVAEFQADAIPEVPAGITRVLLQGFFQHWAHLPPKEVVQQYVYWSEADRNYLDSKYRDLLAIPQKVALHVRRGDYLQHLPRESAAVPAYLDQAISLIKQKVPDCTLVFFSDDLDWVKTTYLANTTVVADTTVILPPPDQDYYQLYLFSQCHHHIISNSAFPWWGAYLSAHSNQINIAPYPWFFDRPEIQGLYLEGWLKVPWSG